MLALHPSTGPSNSFLSHKVGPLEHCWSLQVGALGFANTSTHTDPPVVQLKETSTVSSRSLSSWWGFVWGWLLVRTQSSLAKSEAYVLPSPKIPSDSAQSKPGVFYSSITPAENWMYPGVLPGAPHHPLLHATAYKNKSSPAVLKVQPWTAPRLLHPQHKSPGWSIIPLLQVGGGTWDTSRVLFGELMFNRWLVHPWDGGFALRSVGHCWWFLQTQRVFLQKSFFSMT